MGAEHILKLFHDNLKTVLLSTALLISAPISAPNKSNKSLSAKDLSQQIEKNRQAQWQHDFDVAVQKSDSLYYNSHLSKATEDNQSLKNALESWRFSAIIADDEGNILWQKDPHKKKITASLSKQMTLYLLLDAVDQGKIEWNDQVEISRKAHRRGRGRNVSNWRMNLDRPRQGQHFSYHDLSDMMMGVSDNTAALAIAEGLYGSEKEAVKAMNDMAQKLKMTNTSFADPTGLNKNNISTAWDFYLLNQSLTQRFSDHKDKMVVSTYHAKKYFKRNRQEIENRVIDLITDKTELIKTGYLKISKYNLSMTTKLDPSQASIGVTDIFDKTMENKYSIITLGDRKKRHATKLLAENLQSLAEHERLEDSTSMAPVKPFLDPFYLQ